MTCRRLIAGYPLQDVSELERVTFVMKGGIVYKGSGVSPE